MKIEIPTSGVIGITGQGGYTPQPELPLTKEERAFIKGLKKLTEKTGLAINGCGCCGSPFLQTAGHGYYQFYKRASLGGYHVEDLRWEEDDE